jgi:hypothetical protein
MVVRTKLAAIKLKIVFAVIFIGNIPNSSSEKLFARLKICIFQ